MSTPRAGPGGDNRAGALCVSINKTGPDFPCAIDRGPRYSIECKIMNWDWDKLQERKQRRTGPAGPQKPDFDNFSSTLKKFRDRKFPAGKLILGIIVVLWLLSGIYIVEPAEVGVVLRFGAFNRMTEPGPHYRFPYPIETVFTPKVTEIRRVEIGFRSLTDEIQYRQSQVRLIPEESLMLTGDENIVDVQFIVQYRIKDAKDYLFNVSDQAETVKSAAEAAMREVIGDNKIDSALTTGKSEIQNQTRESLQGILDNYKAGIHVRAVQLQDVHPPREVVDAFKDVASAREDKSRIINEAEAYRNDILPRARGTAAEYVNEGEAYKRSKVLGAEGDAKRFTLVLEEYNKAKDVTRQRLFLETMEKIYGNSGMEKIILDEEAAGKLLPLLPLGDGWNSPPSDSSSHKANTATKLEQKQ